CKSRTSYILSVSKDVFVNSTSLLLSILNMDILLFFIMRANVEGMQRAGVREYFIIPRYCLCQRAMNLQIVLKPA
ncbi:MAG TPA: hypothetical protein VLH61_07660, partial [Bacteroidales bacterium]|nr:hypothetical protein [Bacteroidales bacterium]